MVFRGDFYEANPGSSTRNIEANKIHVESIRPQYVRMRIPRVATLTRS